MSYLLKKLVLWAYVICIPIQVNTISKPIIPLEVHEISKSEIIRLPSCITIEGSVSRDYQQQLSSCWYSLPQSVRKFYEGTGGTIILTSNAFGYDVGLDYSSILAYTDYQTYNIHLKPKANSISGVVHEIGHCVDYYFKFTSVSQEFRAIYQEESANITSFWSTNENNYSTPVEYFAECFQIYFQSNKNLQQYCPKTYEYIKNIIERLG